MVGEVSIPEIDGYSDFRLIGEGMSATVWLAHQLEFERDVAVKILKPGFERGEARDRFEREKRISARLGTHPCVVSVYATGETEDGQPFVAMEYCADGSLADRLEGGGSFTVQEVVEIGIRIASALQAAHERGIIHRDITPRNILLAEYGSALTDFGISRPSGGERTSTAQFLTPVHSAPEAFLSVEPTPQMDIYSLGSTMYTLVTGHPAFPMGDGESFTQYLIRVERDPLPPFDPADVPLALRGVIETAMAKDSADRFASAIEMQFAIERVREFLMRAPRPHEMTVVPSPEGHGSPGDERSGAKDPTDTGAGSDVSVEVTADPSMTRAIGNVGAGPVVNDHTVLLSGSDDLETGGKLLPSVEGESSMEAKGDGRRARRRVIAGAVALLLVVIGSVIFVAGNDSDSAAGPKPSTIASSTVVTAIPTTTTTTENPLVEQARIDAATASICTDVETPALGAPITGDRGTPLVAWFENRRNALQHSAQLLLDLAATSSRFSTMLRTAAADYANRASFEAERARYASESGASSYSIMVNTPAELKSAAASATASRVALGKSFREAGFQKTIAACYY